MSIIEKNASWNNKTRESLYFMVARFLEIDNKHDKYVKLYKQAGYDLMTKNRDVEAEGKQDEKENYRDRKYFINILSGINYDEIKTINGHYQYLPTTFTDQFFYFSKISKK